MKEAELDRWQTDAMLAREDLHKLKESLERSKTENSQYSLKIKDLEKQLEDERKKVQSNQKVKKQEERENKEVIDRQNRTVRALVSSA